MWQFEVLLAPLYALIREVEREQLRGGRLLNLLHAKCHCGIPELQACMQRSVYFARYSVLQNLQSPVCLIEAVFRALWYNLPSVDSILKSAVLAC